MTTAPGSLGPVNTFWPDQGAALKSAFTLGLKLSQEVNVEPPLLYTPDKIAALLHEELRLQTVETLIVVLLNPRRKLIKYVRVADGKLDTIFIHPREVFRPAIVANAAALFWSTIKTEETSTPSTRM